MASAEAAPEKKQYRASSAVALKTLSAWEQANLSPWYHPRFWLDLLIHPSKSFTMNHQRRRARLYALVSFIFVIVSVIANIIFASDGRPSDFLATHAVVNVMLGVSYIISRTRYAQAGKSLGVFAVWLLPYVSFILNLREQAMTDVTVTDSVSWLFTPAWMLMSAIFLSRSATFGVVMLDCFSLLLLPSFADCTFFAIRKLLLFHIVCNSLLLMASIIAFRDKLQLYSQQDGQSHEDQHQAGTLARFLLQPHNEITDRIFRRRSRVLSAFHLILIPSMLVWMIVESSRLSSGKSDGVVVTLTVLLLASSILLYVLSRSQYTRWASRLTLFMLLVAPYIYYQAPTTTMEGQLFANLITMTSAAILGVTLFSGAELVALAAIIFFPTVYSPLFPPHVILSLILLVSSFIYRRDIKEIHDTAFHRDDLYEDDTSDLLIPWEKKYFFGKLSYIQMVQAHYIFGFFLICMLGLAALVGVATSDQQVLDSVTATVVTSEAEADYVVYVTADNCKSPIPQVYTVTGTTGYFEVKNTNPINENNINSIYVSTSKQIGPVVSISLKLGDGSYSLTQYETCTIDQIEVWDPVDEVAYSTSSNQLDDALQATEGSGQPTGRRLLGLLDKLLGVAARYGVTLPSVDNDCGPKTTPILVGRWFGQLVAAFNESPFCRFRVPNLKQDKCVKLLQSVGLSPLSWSANACGCRGASSSVERLLPCYELGCNNNTRTCNGNGQCVILRQVESRHSQGHHGYHRHRRYRFRGGWNKQNLVAVCQCDPGYYGDRCELTETQFCDTDRFTYSYDGTCISSVNPDAGAVGQPTPRLGSSQESDSTSSSSLLGRNFKPAPSTPAPPTATSLTPNHQNMLTVGFIEFLLQDIIVPEQSDNTGARTPNLDPFSPWCSVAPEYINSVSSWIDASPIYGIDETARPFLAGDIYGHIDVAAVKADFVDESPAFNAVVDVLLSFHNRVCDFFGGAGNFAGYDIPGQQGIHATGESTSEERFELARYMTVIFLQNVVRYHVLPSFFDISVTQTLLSSAGNQQQEQQRFDAFFAATTFTPGHYFNRAEVPMGEVPLAAAVNLVTTLDATLAEDATCTLPDVDDVYYSTYEFPPNPTAASTIQLILTQAQSFGTKPVSTAAYNDAHEQSLEYGLPSLEAFTANMLGITLPTETETQTQSKSKKSKYKKDKHRRRRWDEEEEEEEEGEPDWFNELHQQTKPAGERWTAAELAIVGDPDHPELYQSTYPPVAFWLTFGVIRDAYLSDPHRYDIARLEDFTTWEAEGSTVTKRNILHKLRGNCDAFSINSCNSQFRFSFLSMVNGAYALQSHLDYHMSGFDGVFRQCSSFNNQGPQLLAPLVAAQDATDQQFPWINDFSRCCETRPGGTPGCNLCLPVIFPSI